ncbi:hypothetical protein M3Y98_01210300 [Aphelenchoides besseyi]|nr:hypothetical protein M3Y98_01210300 [Aphelenchoides besseyi]
MVNMNTAYLSSHRGLIKIAQIIIGFFISGLLCANWIGGRSCFGEGRIGYSSGLNFVCVVINIVLLILNFIELSNWGLERLYSIVCAILFLIAAILLVWLLVVHNFNPTYLIIATILIAVQFLLYLYDILQIVVGFIICSLLCANWYGGRSCFGEGRLGYASGLNFVVVIINIVLFILNFLDVNAMYKLERMYSVVCCVLFLVAAVLLIWYIFERNVQVGWLIASTVLIAVQFILHLCDVKILQISLDKPWNHQDSPNHHRICHLLAVVLQLEGRVGYSSGLNFVVVVINIVFFILNFLDLAAFKLERLYSVFCTVLFLIATIVMVWWLVEYNDQRGRMIGATVLIGVEFLLFLYDTKILQGELAN